MRVWRARQLAPVGAVAVTGFLCGWQATGIIGGSVMAVALGAGVCPAVFRSPGPPRAAIVKKM